MRDESGWRPEGLADAAPVLQWNEVALDKDDIWLVPEGWANALQPGLEARCQCISYVQNWAYLFSSLPEGVSWSQLPVEFLAVSDPVAHFIKQATYRDAPVVRPGIDRSIFYAPEVKPGGKITVAYMPRKNKALVAQVKAIFEHRNAPDIIRWMPIENMDTFGVAETLRDAHIFFMSGFPEGCPLPPLEAMACGCLPVGFSGLGGWDYMRQAQCIPRFTPWWPLRSVSWGGNGLWCADGDVLDAALCLEEAVTMFANGDPGLDAILRAGQETANAHSTDEQRKSVLEVWSKL